MVLIACLLAMADVLMFMAAMPKVVCDIVHAGGGDALGEITAVTACGNGDAWTAATRATKAREYCILTVQSVMGW